MATVLTPLSAPSNVGGFISELTSSGEVKNAGNPKVETGLRNALVRTLSRLSPQRVLFMEAEFSFTTVAGEAEYSAETSGFPSDAGEFDLVEAIASNRTEEVTPRGLTYVRELLRAPGLTSLRTALYPYHYAWHHQSMIFGPAPSSAITVRGDYHRDARRDSSTGALIDATAASDEYANPWIDAGRDALWNLVLALYYRAFAVEEDRAKGYQEEAGIALRALHREWIRRRAAGMTVEVYL